MANILLNTGIAKYMMPENEMGNICHMLKNDCTTAICWSSNPVIMYAKDWKRQLPSPLICFTVRMSAGVRSTLGPPGLTVFLPLY